MYEYTDAHRLFLQIITAKRILTAVEVRSNYELCCEQYGVQSDLRQFVLSINERLRPMGLVIKKYVQEECNGDTQCFVLVNTFEGEANRHVSTFSIQESKFLRKLMDTLACSNGKITMTDATNLSAHIEPSMKPTDGQAFIYRLVKNQWLLKEEKSNGSNLMLSALALAELQGYIEDTLGEDLMKCPLCTFITFMGYLCPECDCRVHRHCSEKFWSHADLSPVCPNNDCKTEWNYVNYDAQAKRQRKLP